ncbi:hypothetical protein [Nocardia tengchongensis]|uniref:hypothetical protein n=1 Tax=Nocardia tengchongensis TaxID=2055889 RepID=UPI0036B79DCA
MLDADDPPESLEDEQPDNIPPAIVSATLVNTSDRDARARALRREARGRSGFEGSAA